MFQAPFEIYLNELVDVYATHCSISLGLMVRPSANVTSISEPSLPTVATLALVYTFGYSVLPSAVLATMDTE
jgi:hypothetical protein